MVDLPPALQGIFFTHLWENSRIWALRTPTTTVPMEDILWHLKLPVWTTVPGEPRFDLAPATVLNDPQNHPRHWDRIHSADVSYPLEMFKNGERWVIVDGYHRLARLKVQRAEEVGVRTHPKDAWDTVTP